MPQPTPTQDAAAAVHRSSGLRALGAALFGRTRDARPLPTGRAPASTPAKNVMSAGDQWSRVTGVVEGAIEKAGTAANCQTDAAKKLDAAELAFQRLHAEIIDLVPVVKTLRGVR